MSLIEPNWEHIVKMLDDVDRTFFEPVDREKTVFDNPATCFLELLEAGAIVDQVAEEPRQLSDFYQEHGEDQ